MIEKDILEYRITINSLIKPSILPTLMVTMCTVILIPIIIDSYSTDIFVFLTTFFIIFCAYQIIPTTILFSNYYKHDKDKILVINRKKEVLTIKEGKKILEIPFNEIDYLEKLRPTRILFSLVPGNYYCYCINLKNKQAIYLTGFLVQKLEKELPGISFDDVECFYPYIKNR